MFTSQDVAGLIRATKMEPKRDRDDLGRSLVDRLTEIAISFVHGRLWQQKSPPSKISHQLTSINKATHKLLAVLTQDDSVQTREVRYRLTAQAAVKVSTPELTDL